MDNRLTTYGVDSGGDRVIRKSIVSLKCGWLELIVRHVVKISSTSVKTQSVVDDT